MTVSAPVPPPAPVEPLAVDRFDRTVASGLGVAETGGAWLVSGPAGSTSVSDGRGHLLVSAPGGSAAAWLTSMSVRDVAVQTGLSLDQAPTGGGTFAYLMARRVGTSHYRAVVRHLATGGVTLGLSRVVSNAETSLGSLTLPGVTYTPGAVLQVRLDVSGDTTATLRAKAWLQGIPEPADWSITRTDTTASLQAPGAVGLSTYLAGSATRPSRVDLDDLLGRPGGQRPDDAEPGAHGVVRAHRVGSRGVGGCRRRGCRRHGGVVRVGLRERPDRHGGDRSHTYAAAGSYPVTVTVTDDDGATATATASVTVSVPAPAPVPPLAVDGFERTVATGFGAAETGGAWLVSVRPDRRRCPAGRDTCCCPPRAARRWRG